MIKTAEWIHKNCSKICFIVVKQEGYDTESGYQVLGTDIPATSFHVYDQFNCKELDIPFKELANKDVQYFTLKELK